MKRWFFENIGLKILSFLIALCLWAYVGTQQFLQLSIRLPLEVQDIPPGMKVDSDLKTSVQVVFSGRKERIRDLDKEHEELKAVMSLKGTSASDKDLLLYPAVKVEPKPKDVTVLAPNLAIHLVPAPQDKPKKRKN